MPVDEFELLHIGSISHKHEHVISLSQIVPLKAQMFLSNWFTHVWNLFDRLHYFFLPLGLCSHSAFMYESLSVRAIFCKSPPSGNQPKKFNGGIMSVLDVSTISHLPEGTLLKDFTVIWFTRVPAGAKAKAKTNSLAERRDFCKDAIKLSCCF